MAFKTLCEQCDHANTSRKQEDKIRCTRYSRWVDPCTSCKDFCPKMPKLTNEMLLSMIQTSVTNQGDK